MFGDIHFAAQQTRQNSTAFWIPLRNNGTAGPLGVFENVGRIGVA